MKWSAIAIIVVLAALAAVTVIGAFLPREHRAQRAAEFHQQPDAMWAAITDFPAMAGWMPGVSAVVPAEPAPGPLPRWTLRTTEGDMTIEVLEADAPHRLVTRIVEDELPFGGTWTYDISPVDGGSRLVITEDGWISNPLFRFFARYVFGVNRTMDDALRGLGESFGETVLPKEAPG